MNRNLVLVSSMLLLFSSAVFAHPGHVHEVGALAGFIHAIANNSLWLLLFAVIGAIVGYRLAK